MHVNRGYYFYDDASSPVCMYVCVCVRERERESVCFIFKVVDVYFLVCFPMMHHPPSACSLRWLSLARLYANVTTSRFAAILSLSLDRKEKLELGWKLLLGVKPIGEVYAADTAIGMNLNSQRLNIVGSVCTAREIGEIELNLVPSLIKPHGHGAYKWLHSRGGLVVRCPEAPAHILVIEHLHLKGEVLLEVLDDHDEERKLDAKCLLAIGGAGDVVRADIGSHDFQNTTLDIGIGDALDVSIAYLLVPDLQGLCANGVKDG